MEGLEQDAGPSTWERFSKKFKEEPLVPLGAGLTTIALIGAARSMRRGDSSSFNIWLRARVVLQGLTIAAALGGSVYYTADRAKVEAAKKAKEQMEKERRDSMLDRMRAQEEGPGGRLPPPPPSSLPSKATTAEAKAQRKEEAETKRAWIRKQMAASAKEEGRALRLPTADDFKTPPAAAGSGRAGSGEEPPRMV